MGSMECRRSAAPNRCSSTWPVTHIEWRSATAGCSTSRTGKSASATRTTLTAVGSEVDEAVRPRSSSGGSCCTCCRGIRRIRHYGILSSRHRHEELMLCRQLLGSIAPAEAEPQATVKLPNCARR